MVDFRARAGKAQSDPRMMCMPKSKKYSKNDRDVQKNMESLQTHQDGYCKKKTKTTVSVDASMEKLEPLYVLVGM